MLPLEELGVVEVGAGSVVVGGGVYVLLAEEDEEEVGYEDG